MNAQDAPGAPRRLDPIGARPDKATAATAQGERSNGVPKPSTRGGCSVEGTCHFVSCRHHLFIEVTRVGTLQTTDRSSVMLRDSDKTFEAWSDALVDRLVEAEHTCSLDVAEGQPLTLTEVGRLFGISRERIRQVEDIAMTKARDVLSDEEVRELLRERADAPSSELARVDERCTGLPSSTEVRQGIARMEAKRDAFMAGRQGGVSARIQVPRAGAVSARKVDNIRGGLGQVGSLTKENRYQNRTPKIPKAGGRR